MSSGKGRAFFKTIGDIPDAREEAFCKYIDSMQIAYEITGNPDNRSRQNVMRDAFIDGWDNACERAYAELIEENAELHGRLMDVIMKFGLKECETCNTSGIDDGIKDCPACGGDGWVKVS